MQTLGQAMRLTEVGEPLPPAFKCLDRRGDKSRRGQVLMFAGPPNAGKSLFALVAALKVGVRTLYFSADTDEYTMAQRAAAHVTNTSMDTIEEAFLVGAGDVYLDELAAKTSDLHFAFEPAPTLEDIELEIDAATELYGVAPDLIIVDNLMNVVADNGEEWAGMREIVKALCYIARKTTAAVWLLHHTSEDKAYPSSQPSPRRAIQGKVTQLPAVALTLCQDGNGRMGVAVVKNRGGKSDPDAKDPIWMSVFPERMSIIEDPFWANIEAQQEAQ